MSVPRVASIYFPTKRLIDCPRLENYPSRYYRYAAVVRGKCHSCMLPVDKCRCVPEGVA